MIVVYEKGTGEIRYTIDFEYDPSFIGLCEDEGILVSEIEYKGKARDMMVDVSSDTPKLVRKGGTEIV